MHSSLRDLNGLGLKDPNWEWPHKAQKTQKIVLVHNIVKENHLTQSRQGAKKKEQLGALGDFA